MKVTEERWISYILLYSYIYMCVCVDREREKGRLKLLFKHHGWHVFDINLVQAVAITFVGR